MEERRLDAEAEIFEKTPPAGGSATGVESGIGSVFSVGWASWLLVFSEDIEIFEELNLYCKYLVVKIVSARGARIKF
jgi:phytoene dehydrogenase-like protein